MSDTDKKEEVPQPRAAVFDPQNYPEDAERAGIVFPVSMDDFQKVHLMTAEVIAAEEVPKTDKLLVLQLKVGDKTKQIVAGIKQHYSTKWTPPPTVGALVEKSLSTGATAVGPEKPCIVGKTIIIVDNLQPTKIRGIESHGMLLAVNSGDSFALLTTDKPMPSGIRAK